MANVIVLQLFPINFAAMTNSEYDDIVPMNIENYTIITNSIAMLT